MTTVPQLVEVLQELLTLVADRIAHETGFVRRASTLGGAEFSQILVFGGLAHPDATLNELVQAAAPLGVLITEQGLDNRFTAPAAECQRRILATAVGLVVRAKPAVVPILQRFNGVDLQDSPTITLPEVLADLWRGCGNASGTGPAALKVQVQFDYSSGTLRQLVLQAGRAQDRNAPVQRAALPKGALRLADLGYFSLPVLAALREQDVYWLTRLMTPRASGWICRPSDPGRPRTTPALPAADRAGTPSRGGQAPPAVAPRSAPQGADGQ